MKHNKIKRMMAFLLCIIVLMSSNCIMAGRVDAQESMPLEDPAIQTTDETDGVSEDADNEMMLLQEDALTESEDTYENTTSVIEEEQTSEEDTASQEEIAPTDDKGSSEDSQDALNEQENISDDQQTGSTEDISGDNQEGTPDEGTNDTQGNADQETSGDQAETSSKDSTQTPEDQISDNTQTPTDDPAASDENNSNQTENEPAGDDAAIEDGTQTPDDDVIDESSKGGTTDDTANLDDKSDIVQPEDSEKNVTDTTQENPDGEAADNTLINPDNKLDGDVLEEQEGVLTEEEQKQVEEIIALIEALPTMEEIAERFSLLEEAEDEEEYATYYQELYEQVAAAQAAYDALTEAQKEAVTNAEILAQFEWLWSETLEEGRSIWGVLKDDSAYVNEIKIVHIQDGVTPFDFHQHDQEKCYTEGELSCGLNAYQTENDTAQPGDDLNDHNGIVRTFDSVKYEFNVNMKSYDSCTSYNDARIKFEFVLPLSPDQAVFDEAAMTWMDRTEGYAPVTILEMRKIDGEQKECQVLTCYAHLEPSAGGISVVPGNYGQNVTIKVKSMKNGERFAPIISAAMEHGTWKGECSEHGKNEKKTITADPVTVTAAPKYNIQLIGDSSYKDTFDFTTGNDTALNKVTENGKIVGRIMKFGITLQLYNNNRSKGLKGIELPDCTKPISFDLLIDTKYHINQPVEGHRQGEEVSVNDEYLPLVWSYDFNHGGNHGDPNADGRQIFETQRCLGRAPNGKWGGENGCYEGGDWKVTQEGAKIHIEIENYQVDVDQMPLRNADWGDVIYGSEIGIGCFSAGQIWVVQPYNKKENGENQGPEFDIVEQYGEGSFSTTVSAVNLKMTTLSGTEFADEENTNNKQIKQDDDRFAGTLELVLPGALQNRVRYADGTDFTQKGAGTDNTRDGSDYATIGSEIRLLGGFTYHSNGEDKNQLYWGTNLTKFYGCAIEPVDEGDNYLTPVYSGGVGNLGIQVKAYYATKKNGEDWADDNDMRGTYEDDLVFYEKMSAIPDGHVCVGILYCYKGPGLINETSSHPEYTAYHRAKVKEDITLAGNAYMMISTSRVWTKEMFEKLGMNLDQVPNWSNQDTKLSSFPSNPLLSANIGKSTWYTKEEYASDGSGILGKHNSDWSHWGDTLLIIGHKTGVTKHLLQKSGTHEKDTFNLDTDQRVVDFKLQPRVYYDNKEGIGNNDITKTTVDVVDMLPKHLTYVEGSAYIGGEYTQTAANGGMQGEIKGGTQTEPVRGTITQKINGKDETFTTLKWTFTEVEIGKELPPIYYSANIGTRGNADTDVPTGSTSLLNRVYITSQYDRRAHTITNGNYAEAGISVTRGSASSFGKYTLQNVAEEDGEIDYVVYYNNNAQTDTTVDIMDTMPADGVAGSHFTGSYTFAEWKLDVSVCNKDYIEIFYSTDEKYKNKTIQEISSEEWEGWTKAEIQDDGTITLPVGTPTAWKVTGQLAPGQIVKIDLKLKLTPAPSATNKNENNFYINRLSSGDTTVTTQTPTVRRTLEGLAWMDYNRNGVQDEEQEDQIEGVIVELLKLRDGGNPENEADYEPVCYPKEDGTLGTVPIQIRTGQQISIRETDSSKAAIYKPGGDTGRYKFLDLPAGIFAVRFSSGTEGKGELSELRATAKDRGFNDEIDSDAEPVYGNDTLQSTVILGIVMKEAEKIYGEEQDVTTPRLIQESKFNDSGFYPETKVDIQKVNKDGKSLAGAVFTIKDKNDKTISFIYDEEKGYISQEQTEEISQGDTCYIVLASTLKGDTPPYVIGFNGTQNGSGAVLKQRTNDDKQKFQVWNIRDDLYAFYNVGSGKWIDLESGKLENYRTIQIWENSNIPTDNQNQIWRRINNSDGSFALAKGDDNGWRIDLSGYSIKENGTIHLYSKNDTPAQKWLIIPASNIEGAQTELVSDGNGKLSICDLIPGEYTITEIKAPSGYALLNEPAKFILNKDGTVSMSGTNDMVNMEGDVLKFRNEELYELPSAGGIGIYWYTISGSLLMMASLLILYKKRYAGRC